MIYDCVLFNLWVFSFLPSWEGRTKPLEDRLDVYPCRVRGVQCSERRRWGVLEYIYVVWKLVDAFHTPLAPLKRGKTDWQVQRYNLRNALSSFRGRIFKHLGVSFWTWNGLAVNASTPHKEGFQVFSSFGGGKTGSFSPIIVLYLNTIIEFFLLHFHAFSFYWIPEYPNTHNAFSWIGFTLIRLFLD